MKKNLIIFAHYYVPDVAATAQILQELAEGLVKDFHVTIICTVPSYGGRINESYRKKHIYEDQINGIRVLRLSVPRFDKNNKLSRVRNIIAYFFRARAVTQACGTQDVVFALSQPPVLGGMLGRYAKRHLKDRRGQPPKLVYNIQDCNPEQMKAVGYCKHQALYRLLMAIERKNCQNSDLIITIGADMAETIRRRFAKQEELRLSVIQNWADEREIRPLPPDDNRLIAFRRRYGLIDRFVFMYSGNIGLYYDLEKLMHMMGSLKNVRTPGGKDVVFVLVGSGAMLDKLKRIKETMKYTNILFLPYQSKSELAVSLNAADVHLCVQMKGMRGISCPSKFYGICAAQKPVLGVLEKNTQIRQCIEEAECGKCCTPGDEESIRHSMLWFVEHGESDFLKQMGENGRRYLMEHSTKEQGVDRYRQALLNL